MKRIKVRPLVSAVFNPVLKVLALSLMQSGVVMAVARVSTETMTGTTYSITASLPATYDAAGYNNTAMAWVIIDRVINFTPYGSDRPVQKVMPIASAVEKIKGQADYGDGDLVMSYMPADPGQIILKAAEPSNNHYSMRIIYPDGEKHYIDVIVSSFKYPAAKEAEAFLVTVKLGLCRAPVIVAAP